MPDDSEPNVRESVPFFYVTDLPASLAFYVDGLGFRITARWEPEGKIRWCRLQHGGAGIMLQEFWNDGSHDPRPAGKLGLGVSVCFMCADALAIYREARARGLDAGEPFVGNGLWVTSFADPDGYRLDFESPTDVPEDTKLREWEAQSRG
jgi:catechol 2,3-dioxygenase-like lactoylglutathione lyase family enzyme